MRTIALAALAALAACKTAPASYPDSAKVQSAEKKWCDALAKYETPEDQHWRHGDACAAAAPAGSAPFIAQMTACYLKVHDEHGDSAPDLGAIIATCADEVLAGAESGDVSQSEAVQARCARMEKCEKVPKAECLAAFDKLEPMQKAGLTSMYNLRAQHDIADCLDGASCSDNEDEARGKCYDAVQRRRVWLPDL